MYIIQSFIYCLFMHFRVLLYFSIDRELSRTSVPFPLCVNVAVQITQPMAHFSSESTFLLSQMCSEIGEAVCLAVCFTLT